MTPEAAKLRAEIEAIVEKSVSLESSSGKDGTNGEVFIKNKDKEIDIICKKIGSGKYQFTSYEELLKTKGRWKSPRAISKCTIRDKIVLKYINSILLKELTGKLSFSLPNQMVRQVKNEYLSCLGTEYGFLKIDLSNFYDSIPRGVLFKRLQGDTSPEIYNLVFDAICNQLLPSQKRTIRGAAVEIKGVHQGLPISNTLATYYMHDIDNKMKAVCKYYHRYVDDILIIDSESKLNDIKKYLESLITDDGLSVNHSKTMQGNIGSELEFLGYAFNNGKIKVRSSSFESFISRIISIVNTYKNFKKTGTWKGYEIKDELEAEQIFINNLNEKITGAISGKNRYGWIAYFVEINSLGQLRMLDRLVRERTKGMVADPEKKIKNLIRSYYSHRFAHKDNYIINYDIFDDIMKKYGFLVRYGHIRDGISLTSKEIEEQFKAAKTYHLSRLDFDVGFMY